MTTSRLLITVLAASTACGNVTPETEKPPLATPSAPIVDALILTTTATLADAPPDADAGIEPGR